MNEQTAIEHALELVATINRRAPVCGARVSTIYAADTFDTTQSLALLLTAMYKSAPSEEEFAPEAVATIVAIETSGIAGHIANAIRMALVAGYCQAHEDIQTEVIRT